MLIVEVEVTLEEVVDLHEEVVELLSLSSRDTLLDEGDDGRALLQCPHVAGDGELGS